MNNSFGKKVIRILICLLVVFNALYGQKKSFESNNTPGKIIEVFKNFNTTDIVPVKIIPGDILFINWRIAVKKGSLVVSVKNKKQLLWKSEPITQDDTADYYIPIKTNGNISINVSGKKAEGEVAINYQTKPGKEISVKINSNVELFGLMMQLDNAPDALAVKDSAEIGGRRSMWKDWYSLAVKNYTRFRLFDSCTMMQMYRKYVAAGLYNDFFISLLLQANQVPQAALNDSMDDDVILAFSKTGNMQEAKVQAAAFFKAFNQFYYDVHFDKYLQEYQPYLDKMLTQVRANLPPLEFVPVMEHFYQKQFNGYCFVPGLDILNGMGFGKMNRKTATIYNSFGPFGFITHDDQHPDPGFNFADKIQNLAVHEFGHSFVNPAIDKLPDDLVQSTEKLYEPIREIMARKAYTSWKMCLYEHFVKAGEILISRYMGNKKTASQMIADCVRDGFIYVPFIVNELQSYITAIPADRNYDIYVAKIMERLRDAKEFK